MSETWQCGCVVDGNMRQLCAEHEREVRLQWPPIDPVRLRELREHYGFTEHAVADEIEIQEVIGNAWRKTLEREHAATYLLNNDGESFIQCLKCGRKSYHPVDIEKKYCGKCREFHD